MSLERGPGGAFLGGAGADGAVKPARQESDRRDVEVLLSMRRRPAEGRWVAIVLLAQGSPGRSWWEGFLQASQRGLSTGVLLRGPGKF